MIGFGERLKELRKKSNITQAELAEKLNVHSQTISRWERDISEPDMSVYETISKTLSVPLEELWGVTIPEKTVNGQFNLSQLGKAIYTERKRLRESQDELASVAGVSSDIVSKWERGLICPDIDTLLSLANHFKVSPSELYYFQLEPEVVEITGLSVQPKLKKPSKKVILIAVFSSILLIALAAVILSICLKPFATSNNKTVCEHVYRQEETNATCTAQGYITNVCIKCGDAYISDYIDKLPHNAGDWITDSEATCTQEGSKYKECSVCHNITERLTIEKLEHKYETATVPSTCSVKGYTLYTCSMCSNNYKSDYIELLPHKQSDWITDTESTCGQAGSKHKECLVCGTQTETASIEKLSHQYGENITAPTCTAQGYTIYTCVHCGDSYISDYTPTIDHIAGDWIIDRAATCGVAGSRHKECAVCKTTIETAVIDKLAHSYIDTIVPPEGDNYGYFLYTCELCGDSYKDNYFLPDSSGLQFDFDYGSKTCTVTGIDELTDTKIEIPATVNGCKVTTIGWRAFEDCVTLQEVIIPETVTEIGLYAFKRCVMLQEVIIPDSVTFLGDDAFTGCRLLKTAVLSNNLQRLEYGLFSDCENLQEVVIPDGVTIIEDRVFYGCRKLTEIKLPVNLLSIGLSAFELCGSLTKIIIPQSVKYLGGNAFTGCSSLVSAEFGQPEGWIADEIIIDSILLADTKTAAEYLTIKYNLYIWVRK